MNKNSLATFLSLFASIGTLFCCALPAILSLLGIGAVFASLTASVPQVLFLVEYKNNLFVIAGVLLVLTGLVRSRTKNSACPADPAEAEACKSSRKISLYIYILSCVIYVVAFFFAYLAVYLWV